MTSRLVFDAIPAGEWGEKTRTVLGAAFRSLQSVLDSARGGLRMREQLRVVDCVIDTATVPYARVTVLGANAPPLGVLLISARVQRSTSGRVLTSATVDWEWRGGGILIYGVAGLAAATRYDCVIAVLE